MADKNFTIDNPITFRRECWQDGKLVCFCSADILECYYNHRLEGNIFLGAHVGDWRAGQYFGDLNALPADRNPFKTQESS